MRSGIRAGVGAGCVAGGAAVFGGVPGGEVWPFDLATNGSDILWVSPSAVDPDAARYVLAYHIERVLANVSLGPIPLGQQDVTDQVPAELLDVTEHVPGPAPIVLADESVVAPPPPEPPAFSGRFFVRGEADGHGRLDVTEVDLGTVMVDLGPPLGVQTLTITGARFIGEVTAQAVPLLADINLDCLVDTADLGILLTAFGTPDDASDLNEDGVVDTADLGLSLGTFGTACP